MVLSLDFCSRIFYEVSLFPSLCTLLPFYTTVLSHISKSVRAFSLSLSVCTLFFIIFSFFVAVGFRFASITPFPSLFSIYLPNSFFTFYSHFFPFFFSFEMIRLHLDLIWYSHSGRIRILSLDYFMSVCVLYSVNIVSDIAFSTLT